MRLDLDRTPNGASDLPLAGDLGLDFGAGGPNAVHIDGTLRVDNLESRLVVRGEVNATGDAECGRCLNTFSLSFPVPVEIVVLRDTDTGEDDEGETLVIHQRRGEVDLTDAVREAAVLAVPQLRVCCEDCRGLCPTCGADLNRTTCECDNEDADPRWDGLPE